MPNSSCKVCSRPSHSKYDQQGKPSSYMDMGRGERGETEQACSSVSIDDCRSISRPQRTSSHMSSLGLEASTPSR